MNYVFTITVVVMGNVCASDSGSLRVGVLPDVRFREFGGLGFRVLE